MGYTIDGIAFLTGKRKGFVMENSEVLKGMASLKDIVEKKLASMNTELEAKGCVCRIVHSYSKIVTMEYLKEHPLSNLVKEFKKTAEAYLRKEYEGEAWNYIGIEWKDPNEDKMYIHGSYYIVVKKAVG